MSRRVFLGVAVLALVSTIGHSSAAAQSGQQSSIVRAAALRAFGESEPGTPNPLPVLPQQIGRNRTRGALWGGGIGLVAGGLLGGLTVSSGDDGDFGGSLTESAATGQAVLLGAAVGAGIGALLGATVFAPSRRPADTGASALSFSIHPSGAAIAVSGRIRVGR